MDLQAVLQTDNKTLSETDQKIRKGEGQKIGRKGLERGLLGYNLKMERNSNNKVGKKAINLFEYVSNNISKPKEKTVNRSIDKSVSVIPALPSQHSAPKSQWSYGLDTLLHFNDSLNLSSINPHKNKFFTALSQTNRYEQMISQAREEVEKMRMRRLESENEWKKKKNHKVELDESLAESEVASYDLDSQVYPLSSHRIPQNNDRFASQLRQQITKGKAIDFASRIKAIFFSKFLQQLTLYTQILDFQSKRSKTTLRQSFSSWKQVIQTLQSRKQIRSAILQRIHAKRNAQSSQDYLTGILNA